MENEQDTGNRLVNGRNSESKEEKSNEPLVLRMDYLKVTVFLIIFIICILKDV